MEKSIKDMTIEELNERIQGLVEMMDAEQNNRSLLISINSALYVVRSELASR